MRDTEIIITALGDILEITPNSVKVISKDNPDYELYYNMTFQRQER